MKVTFEELKAAFNRVLLDRGVKAETADACAEMFARTTESGVYSHGVNRFPRFIQQLDAGDIIPDAQPKRVMTLGAIEQWDAQRSIGNLTAKKMPPFSSASFFSAFSRASSSVPTLKNAHSGRSSALPSTMAAKLRTVSFRGTYLPLRPVKFSATAKGWDKNFCSLRARCRR